MLYPQETSFFITSRWCIKMFGFISDLIEQTEMISYKHLPYETFKQNIHRHNIKRISQHNTFYLHFAPYKTNNRMCIVRSETILVLINIIKYFY